MADSNNLESNDKEKFTFGDRYEDVRLYSAIVCDQNKVPILSVISPIFSSCSDVLEIGSGTGQHAIYFSKKMPYLTWHTSDREPYLDGISTWLSNAESSNIMMPIELDVSSSRWPKMDVDAVFTANSLHTMHHQDISNLFVGVSALLKPEGDFVIYGPFKYNDDYVDESNKYLDQWLKEKDVLSGIKNFQEIEINANKNDLYLINDYEMPGGNRLLHFSKR